LNESHGRIDRFVDHRTFIDARGDRMDTADFPYYVCDRR